MFPLQDINPTRRFPILTTGLIVINVLVFLWQMTLSPQEMGEVFRDYALVPARFSADPFSLTAMLDTLRSMFLHGGFEHIAGNMLYLYLFGDNLEDRLGGILYLVLYFASGLVAVVAQVLVDPSSTIPMVGASGAIAGVLGGYLFLYPTVRVRGIVFLGRFATIQEWPAFIVLGLWFVLQLFSGFASLGADFQSGGVAFFAHIGGFVAGLILTVIFAAITHQPDKDARERRVYDKVGRRR